MVRLHRWQHAWSSTDELGVEERLRKGPGFVWVTHGGGTTWEEGLVGWLRAAGIQEEKSIE